MENIYRELFLPNNSISFVETVTYNTEPYSSNVKHSNHEEYEIYWFVEGDLFFSYDGRRLDISPGDMIVISGRQTHRVIVNDLCTYHRKRILCKEEIFCNIAQNGFLLKKELQKKKIIHLKSHDVKQEQFDLLFGEIEHRIVNNTPYNQFCTFVTLFSFLIKANEYCQKEEHRIPACTGRAYEIIKYIDEHIDNNLSYEVLSKEFFFSPKSLCNFFKKETGFSLGKYIAERRIVKAKTMLLAGASAHEAAIAAGFSDYSVFYRNFLKKTGITPASYTKSVVGYQSNGQKLHK